MPTPGSDIADDLALDVLSAGQQECLYELGSLDATAPLFESGVVVHVPTGDRSGSLVSLEGDAGVSGREVVSLVRGAAAGTNN